MPTNRTRTQRKRKDVMQLDETVEHFLLTGHKPEKGTPAWTLYTSRFFDGGEEIRKTLEAYGKQLHAGKMKRFQSEAVK